MQIKMNIININIVITEYEINIVDNLLCVCVCKDIQSLYKRMASGGDSKIMKLLTTANKKMQK